MITIDTLKNKEDKICVVGLGYVGLPLAVELAKHFEVIGLDVKQERIDELKNGFDRTKEVSADRLAVSTLQYTADPAKIRDCRFIVVAVPTPVNDKNLPDLFLVEKATEMVGKNMSSGSVIVYESTVYPGVTEDICLPILEKESGMKFSTDFTLGYSPERINPGDKEHTINTVTKIVSASDQESLAVVAYVYGQITKVYRASSIKVAEAAKVIENTQRDVNIALMNELAVIFSKLGISTYDVLEAAGTKWNFLPFKPGLVGGHCIGVDPYYLTYKSQQIGYEPEVILSGRRINDGMAKFVVEQVATTLSAQGKNIKDLSVNLFGLTFKENVPDARNSKAVDIYKEIKNYGATPLVYDPLAYTDEVEHEYGIQLNKLEELKPADVLFVPVAHDSFKEILENRLGDYLVPGGLIVDIKHILNKEKVVSLGFNYWTL
ncbi:MAG: hypothetical protein ACD_72C00044G0002 [uncultured bacterium]|nr:MAG: hypothetical protein ACD_72C00044G0002 [uncultured bacterium]